MSEVRLVKFIGGPFDGFRQTVCAIADELPARVAIPMNDSSARTLRLDIAPSSRPRKVIYHLNLAAGVAEYCFHKACVSEATPTTELARVDQTS